MSKFSFIFFTIVSFGLCQERDQIQFPHDYHIIDEELGCEDCHKNVEQSVAVTDHALLPSKEDCADCHEDEIDEESEDSNCALCHTHSDYPLTYPAKPERFGRDFSHTNHISQYSDCTHCHGGINTDDGSKPLFIWKDKDCKACHESSKPANHTLIWEKEHGFEMNSAVSENCALCHDDTFCDDCHKFQQFTPLTHTTNYLVVHGWEATAGSQECSTCHEPEEDCFSCHRQEKVMPMNHNFANWTGLFLDNGGDHSYAAHDAPELCQTCHRPQSDDTCLRCHGDIK